jgi:hypothetical protein
MGIVKVLTSWIATPAQNSQVVISASRWTPCDHGDDSSAAREAAGSTSGGDGILSRDNTALLLSLRHADSNALLSAPREEYGDATTEEPSCSTLGGFVTSYRCRPRTSSCTSTLARASRFGKLPDDVRRWQAAAESPCAASTSARSSAASLQATAAAAALLAFLRLRELAGAYDGTKHTWKPIIKPEARGLHTLKTYRLRRQC